MQVRKSMIGSVMVRSVMVAAMAAAASVAVAAPDSPGHTHSPSESAHSYKLEVPEGRFGLANLLDGRSAYYKHFFPAPLTSPEATVETQLRVDYTHVEDRSTQGDQVEAEFEKNFGLLVLGVGTAWSSVRGDLGAPDTSFNLDDVGPIELAARHPIYQYVGGACDSTVVAKFTLEVPTTSEVSKDFVFAPEIIIPTKIGDRYFVQPSAKWEIEVGPEGRGYNALGYNLALGFHLFKDELNLPALERLTPLFEIAGDLPLNQESRYDGSISASIGFRADLDPVGGVHPKLGLGYLVPLDQNAREQFDWGVITSLVLEF